MDTVRSRMAAIGESRLSNKIKVLHIVGGSLDGGAAKGTYWLHLGLLELGFGSKILNDSKLSSSDKSCKTIATSRYKLYKSYIKGVLDRLPTRLYVKKTPVLFSTGFVGSNIIHTQAYVEADIVHLHWINNGFINVNLLKKINKPIIWTIRDMWPMTGGCHYTLGCNKYIKNCGSCPQLDSRMSFDLSSIVLQRKKRIIPKTLTIVAISSWLKNELKKSSLFKEFDIRKISNNIAADLFFPIKKFEARRILGLDNQKRVLLVGSTNISDTYKGFDKFLSSLEFLPNKDRLVLCIFGTVSNEVLRKIPLQTKVLGYLSDDISLRAAYNSADVFIAPSIMEAFGKTIAESMCCMTPVVAFNATGPKDIIDHKVNGYLAKPFNPKDLAAGIEWILSRNKPEYDVLCENARYKVLTHFDSRVVAKQYIELYKEILAQ